MIQLESPKEKEIADMKPYSVRRTKSGSQSSLFSDAIFLIGLICGFVVCAILIIALLLIANFDKDFSLEVVPVLVSLIVAAASSFLATKALLEQKKTREASTDPVLVAHFGQRADARELVTFKVSNVGAGAALNVKIDVQIPEDEILRERKILTNIFEPHHPIAIILQGSSVEFSFALGPNILGENPLPPFIANLEYGDLNGDLYTGEFELDVSEMRKLGAEKSPEMRVVSALENIVSKLK